MKKKFGLAIAAFAIFTLSCKNENKESNGTATNSNTESAVTTGGQENVKDDVSQKDVVKVAVGSPDHTTLVKALQAANLVNSLANAGPFTVFAPTNAAFDKLPAGTVEDLLKPENKEKLAAILEHHVMTSALAADFFQDGQSMGMVDGTNATFHIKGKDVYIGDAKIIGSVRASNGFVHVIDGVIVPK